MLIVNKNLFLETRIVLFFPPQYFFHAPSSTYIHARYKVLNNITYNTLIKKDTLINQCK